MSADKDEIKDNNAGEAVNDRSLPSHELESGTRAGDQVGLALIEQERVIPRTADRKVTTKWEYWTYTLFFFSGQGVGIGSYGGSLQQALLSLQFPGGTLEWGGKQMSISSVLLDLNGIVFAVQLVCLLLLGPYADYGSWRPWLLIFFQGLVWITTFAMSGLHKASQWSAANALSVIGNVGNNVSNTFYWAAFAGLVRDLPKVTEAEQEVLQGTRRAEDLAQLDMLERSTLFNWVNIVGSGTNLVALGVATGVSYKIGSATTAELLKSYQILLGLWGALTVVCTLPWFVLEQHRPGQKLPDGTGWLLAGPKQVWQAVKCARHLSQIWLYLIAYFLLQESFGTSFTVVSILQNKMINFNAMDLSGLNLVSYLGGGGGTLLALIVQRRFKIPIKVMLVYGAVMTLGPNLWGVIGAYTQRIGFHHEWEFWLASAWNFQTAAFGSYSTTMITELVPAPKVFMFFALFNTVGKTSGFVGPFVTSAIINRSSGNQNLAFWFLFGMGLAGCAVLALVNPNKAKIDAVRFLEREAQDLYSIPTEHEKGKDLVQNGE